MLHELKYVLLRMLALLKAQKINKPKSEIKRGGIQAPNRQMIQFAEAFIQ